MSEELLSSESDLESESGTSAAYMLRTKKTHKKKIYIYARKIIEFKNIK